jgi:hypothetical protein
VAVTTRRREAAPNPEWVLMYEGGLPGRRMAELASVPVSTVSYHLRLARAADAATRRFVARYPSWPNGSRRRRAWT